MSVSVRPFGLTGNGEQVHAYTIANESGAAVTLLDYGATVQSLYVPNAQGGLTDVVLGYDSVSDYESHDAYLGATVGRFANRIGMARFSLNGQEYRLAANNGANCLHGGQRGFDRFVWQAADTQSDFYATLLSSAERKKEITDLLGEILGRPCEFAAIPFGTAAKPAARDDSAFLGELKDVFGSSSVIEK